MQSNSIANSLLHGLLLQMWFWKSMILWHHWLAEGEPKKKKKPVIFIEAWACIFWKSDSSKSSYFPVFLSLWQDPGQVVEFISGGVIKTQHRQILAGNVLDKNDSTSGFQRKASVFFCKMTGRSPSEISSSISLLFFKFCRMFAKPGGFCR